MANGVSVLGVYFREPFLLAEICGWLNRTLTTRKSYVEMCGTDLYWLVRIHVRGNIKRVRLVCEAKKDGEKIFREIFFSFIADKMAHRPT